MKARLMPFSVLLALGGALLWMWWRRHVAGLWQRPQIVPLSAQWLTPNWPHVQL